MSDENEPTGEPAKAWQSLDRLCFLTGLRPKEIMNEVGRGVERLRISGHTLYRLAAHANIAPRERSEEEVQAHRDRRSGDLGNQWESVLKEYRTGLRKRPADLQPRASETMRSVHEPMEAVEIMETNESQPAPQAVQSWSRFPGWFGSAFEGEEQRAH